jgi:hypothetical protein
MPEKSVPAREKQKKVSQLPPSGDMTFAKEVRTDLYQVAPLLGEEARKKLGVYLPGVFVYLQDPLIAQTNPDIGIQEIQLFSEPGLGSGPASARLVVVDYNADTGKLTPGAIFEQEKSKAPHFEAPGGTPLDKEAWQLAEFRQVNAWAVAQSVLDLFERSDALGRALPWGVQGNRLFIIPHAGYGENAYYDRNSKSLQFYYYGDPKDPKYTCLSHDIVAHETGHAILDGLRPYYYNFTSVQTAAFHEFVADLAAILSGLRNNQVRLNTSKKTGGDLTRDNVIQGLAEEFGYHISGVKPLREANNQDTMDTIQGNLSPHDCSLVLTGAMFEILAGIAQRYLDEEKSNSGEGGDEQPGDPHPLNALWWATQRIICMALQPLDYLPPVDVDFADYARAVLRHLLLFEPYDSPRREFYIDLVKRVFHERKLCRGTPEQCSKGGCALESCLLPDEWDVFHSINDLSSSPTAAYTFLHHNRRKLFIPNHQDIRVVDLYRTHKRGREARRLPGEIVLQYVWSEEVLLDEPRFGSLQGKRTELLCGGTLVFDENNNLLSWMHKPGTEMRPNPTARESASKKRLQILYEEGVRRRNALRDHIANQVQQGLIGLQDAQAGQLIGPWTQPVQALLQNGILHLEITPGMRNTLNTAQTANGMDEEEMTSGILDWGGHHVA